MAARTFVGIAVEAGAVEARAVVRPATGILPKPIRTTAAGVIVGIAVEARAVVRAATRAVPRTIQPIVERAIRGQRKGRAARSIVLAGSIEPRSMVQVAVAGAFDIVVRVPRALGTRVGKLPIATELAAAAAAVFVLRPARPVAPAVVGATARKVAAGEGGRRPLVRRRPLHSAVVPIGRRRR